jgi:phosphomethylpyrimidine synthase
MKIPEDVRKYAAEQRVSEEQALRIDLEQEAREFVEEGANFTSSKIDIVSHED